VLVRVTDPISSREVNAELRAVVWPALREQGFMERTQRVAWRDHPDSVAVVDFWSFNSYTAATMGVTTYSFQVNLGIRARCSSNGRSFVKIRDGKLRPREAECDVRRVLWKTIAQVETDKPQVWFVREDGSNLREVLEDARSVLLSTGMAWIDEFSDLSRILAFAENEPEGWDAKGTRINGTWGLGRLGCPARMELIADIKSAPRT
jgi:hypothetical protein